MSRRTQWYVVAANIALASLFLAPVAPAESNSHPSAGISSSDTFWSPTNSSAAAGEEQSSRETTGTITAIDQQAKTMTVKGAVMTKSFKITSDTQVTNQNSTSARLDDLKVGDKVRVSYTDLDGVLTANSVVRIESNSGGSSGMGNPTPAPTMP